VQENQELEDEYSRAQTMKWFAHSFSMRPEIIVFGLRDWVVKEYQKASAIVGDMQNSTNPSSLTHQIYDLTASFIQTGSRAVMYLLLAMKPDHFGLPLASLTYLEQSTQSLYSKIFSLWGRTGYMFSDMMAIQELFECIEIEPEIKLPEEPVEYEKATSGTGSGMKIEMRNVSFKYPGKDEFVLKDISFVLQPGETLALLGFNGSGILTSFIDKLIEGKSTLIKLLLRLYEPIEGNIFINDVDIARYDQDELHEKVSVLFQDYSTNDL
jgi:ABC-type multidrug transport system fused ATPase/permease subunit